jgi:hypothetical protein
MALKIIVVLKKSSRKKKNKNNLEKYEKILLIATRKDEWEEGEGKNMMGKLPCMKSIL